LKEGHLINSLFARALKRSHDTFGRAMRLFDRDAIDGEVWDELEELLISADVRVSTTGKLIEQAKQQAKEGVLSDGSQVRDALKSAMVKTLSLPAIENLEDITSPRVILVVGVSGSGGICEDEGKMCMFPHLSQPPALL